MTTAPIYRSDRSIKSLGQRYDVFEDRFELQTLLGEWTIPFSEVASIAVQESNLQALINGRLDLRRSLSELKLDCVDVTEHVTIERTSGWFERVAISPEDPEAFVAAGKLALEAWRQLHSPEPWASGS